MRFVVLTLLGLGFLYHHAGAQNVTNQARADQYVQTADSLSEQGWYQASNRWFQQAESFYRANEKWDQYVACLNGLGYNLTEMFSLDSAEAVIQRAIRIGEQHLGAQHLLVARSHYLLGLIQLYQGKYDAALNHCQLVLRLQPENSSEARSYIADSYQLRGMINMRVGAYDEALTSHQKALAIRKDLVASTHYSIADSYYHIGVAHHYKGAYDRALTLYQRALSLRKASFGESHPAIAESYHRLGAVYVSRGEHDQALDHFQRALAIWKQVFGETHPLIATCYSSIGTLYRSKNDYHQALTYHRRAMSLWRAQLGERHPEITISYNRIGTVYRDLEEFDSSLVYHQRALSLTKDHLGSVHPRTAMTLTRIGRVHHRKGAHRAALLAYRESMVANGATFTDTSLLATPTVEHYLDGQQLLYTFEAKAKTLTEAGLDAVAYDTYVMADSLLMLLNRSYATRGDKVSLAKTARRLHERAIHVSIQRYHATQDKRYQQAAFYFSERSKAGVLTEALSTLEAKKFGQVPDSLLAKEASLKKDRSFYRSQLATADSLRYKNKLFAINRQYDSMIQMLETQYPDYYQLKYATHTASVPLVQSQLASDEAMITYFLGDSTRYAFVITADQFRAVPLPLDRSLNTQLLTMQEVLRSGNTTYEEYQVPAHALYRQLLAPVVEDSLMKGVDRLTIVRDGPLGYLPFELLLTELPPSDVNYANLPYLLRRYTLHYGYSATWLLHPFSRSGRSAIDQYIAFAPEYGGSTSTEASARARVQLVPLQFNRKEANNIKQYLSGVTVTGQEAVEERFKKEAHRYSVIHLAMHALVNNEDPMNSQLIFSQDTTGSLEDGYLNAYELYDLNLSADLAVLSACGTGYGKLEQGEGILSLARAFAYAGCPSIVMSQWLVDDAASAQLMNHFYRYLSEGMSKDESLRQAKLAYLDEVPARKAHPYFWSNFVLVGDATPLASTSSRFIWMYILGAIIILGVAGGAYHYKLKHRRKQPDPILH